MSKHCMKVEDECRFHTCQGRTNRMNELAICHRHAAIRGMPAIEAEEARMITKAILAMRGINQKKQKKAHDEGTLMLMKRPMAYKALSKAWLRNLGAFARREVWNSKPREEDKLIMKKAPLDTVCCPACGHGQSTMNNRLKARVGYGQLTCNRCR